jgi:cytochrome c oxidase subunit 2
MNLGENVRSKLNYLSGLAIALPLALLPKLAFAQGAADSAAAPAPPSYTPYGPDMIKGQPTPGGVWFQAQHSPAGKDALWMHDTFLAPTIIGISLLVLGLLIYVMLRYNKRANPVPSKVSHNTTLEVLWTGIPILILVTIAVPSINLIVEQYKSPPKKAVTVKATGSQWYWTYSYPDNGGFEVVSNMLPDGKAVAEGLPPQLAVDHRMVVPAGVPIRLQTTGADVIHSFSVPSLWFKLDAIPGRINERLLEIDEPGIYYGQCSELCGARHGYMPIAIEAVPMERFRQWILSQGGKINEQEDVAPAAQAAASEQAAAPAKPVNTEA